LCRRSSVIRGVCAFRGWLASVRIQINDLYTFGELMEESNKGKAKGGVNGFVLGFKV
jgi:hypothetical protein